MKKIIVIVMFCTFLPCFLFAQSGIAGNDIFAGAVDLNYSPALTLNLFLFRSNIGGKVLVGDKNNPTAQGLQFVGLDSDLNFDDEISIGFGFNWQYAERTSLDIKYSEFEHESLLNNASFFRGKNFKAGSEFKTKNRWFDVAFIRKLHKNEKDMVKQPDVRAVFGIKTANIIVTAHGEESGTIGTHLYADWEKTIYMPYVGFNGSTNLGRSVALKGHCVFGKSPTFDGYSANHYDLGLNFVFDMHKKQHGNIVKFDLGYRKLEYDADGDGDNVIMRFSGPVVSCNVIF